MEKFMYGEFNIYRVSVYEAYQKEKRIMPIINRNNYALCVIEDGCGKIVFSDGTEFERIPGDIFLITKNSSYYLEVTEPFNSFNIGFSVLEDIELKPFVFHAQNYPELTERFKKVLNIWNAQKPGYKEKVLSEFYNIIYTMKKHYFADYLPTEKYNVIKPAMEYIQANYRSKRIKVEELAKMCKISPEYFRDVFKRLNGYSPINYIQNLQITYAKQLMDSGAYTISEISAMLGFTEISQFSRKFKKITGVSPREYMKTK